ncbi:TadE-like protein [Micromonospora purpureochromogenes]|uniref:TadE-like protein n=1 Tax=Micromonospora purpureochromogenes TaxID=47872 RepID=A0A1C4Z8W6_9ACTN|nr:TadE/TadG family type IV pilus assembly protein [Micromonospora purpureochromogenes]SCF29151.1 TadE-like protein [Micromonospora purpureochromogenes]
MRKKPTVVRPRPTRRGRADPFLRDRGSSPVEFAVIALPMLLLTFAVVQTGLVFFAQSIALAAATQGVNGARGYQSTVAAGETRAEGFLSTAGVGLDDRQVVVTRTGTEVRATVTGQAVTVLPGFSWTISKSAHGPVERPTTP